MVKTALRNAVVVALGVPLYWLLIRHLSDVLDWLGATNERLLAGLIVHLIFGAIGAVAFAGKPAVRAALVFLCVVISGVLMEVFFPDPRHWGVQLFVSIPFGGVAAVGALLWAGVRHKPESPRHV